MARVKRSMGKRAERTLKSAMVYTLTLFVDVLIVYFIVRSFSIAYDFSYNVFSDSAKDPGAVTYLRNLRSENMEVRSNRVSISFLHR